MVTWALVAGVIALWRRSAPVAMLLGGWLACFIFLKASSAGRERPRRQLLPLHDPGLPAVLLRARRAAAARAHLRPAPRRGSAPGPLVARHPAGVEGRARGLGRRARAAVLAIAALPPLRSPEATRVPDLDQYVPANAFALTATAGPEASSSSAGRAGMRAARARATSSSGSRWTGSSAPRSARGVELLVLLVSATRRALPNREVAQDGVRRPSGAGALDVPRRGDGLASRAAHVRQLLELSDRAVVRVRR